MNTSLLVKKIKEESQDFDWYPTTDEILQCIKKHSQKTFGTTGDSPLSVLDIGAGDAKGANYISCGGTKRVIEISSILTNQMPSDCIPVGTDFLHANIMPIETDIIFSNPPYQASGGFALWAKKIITEGNAQCIYLVIPERWKNDDEIKIAIEEREATVEVIGEFNFLKADRKARGIVNVIFVDLCSIRREMRNALGGRRKTNQNVDPFDVWVKNTFQFNAPESKYSSGVQAGVKEKDFEENLENQLVKGRNQIQALVELYNQELLSFKNLYDSIAKIPYVQLRALGTSVDSLKESIKENLANMKKKYWIELFDRYEPITSKLTKRSRENMLGQLHKQVQIDFTESNIYAVTVWCCKNANEYFDKQLIETYEKLLNQASVQMYKSNKKTFEDEDWRWNRGRDKIEKYCLKLDYRIIISGYGRLSSGYYAVNGLYKTGHELLNDVGTIAQNLGFPRTQKSESFDWTNGQVSFTWPDGTIFMQAKGHSNGNLHLKINIEALKAISIKFGQLKKWIKSASHAAEEMSIPVKEAEKYFDVSHSILPGDSILKICG